MTLHIRCQCLEKVLEQTSCKLISTQGTASESEGGVSGFLDFTTLLRPCPLPGVLFLLFCGSLSPSFLAQLQESCSEAPAHLSSQSPNMRYPVIRASPWADVSLQSTCRHQSPAHSMWEPGPDSGRAPHTPLGAGNTAEWTAAQPCFLSLFLSVEWPGEVTDSPQSLFSPLWNGNKWT